MTRRFAVFFLALASVGAAQVSAGDMIFDVRNGDQEGKLMLKETELAFESLTDSRHSRNWTYSDIRELSRKGKKELRVRPNKGSRYDFQFKDRTMRDNLYKLISDRIVAARQGAARR
ncbi:MAG: hypothetical protein R2729_29850 [Bryobacteraceae bacterium]